MLQKIVTSLNLALADEIKGTKMKTVEIKNLIRQDGVLQAKTQFQLNGEGVLMANGKNFVVNARTEKGVVYFEGVDDTEQGDFKDCLFGKDDTTLTVKVANEFKKFKPTELVEKIFQPKPNSVQNSSFQAGHLNNAQNGVVSRSLSEEYLLVVGPGGTGKTETITALIGELLSMGKRILVVSPANLAVEGVFSKVVKSNTFAEGEMLLAIDTEHPELKNFSPRALAKERISRIKDELSVYEPALKKLVVLKNELLTILDPASEIIEASETLAKNAERESRILESEIAGLNVEKANLQKRLDRLNTNGIMASLTYLVSSDKKDEIESQLLLLDKKLANKEEELSVNNSKIFEFKEKAERQRQEIVDAKSKLEEVNRQGKICKDLVLKLKKELSEIDNVNLFKNARLAGATIFAAATNKKIAAADFDVLIVDEASMASLPALLLACNVVKEKIVMFGDPMQLPPISQAQINELEESIFDVLGITDSFQSGVLHEKAAMLDTQYRCHPEIAQLTSELFYGGMLKNGRVLKDGAKNKALFIKNVVHNAKDYNESKGFDKLNTNQKHLKAVFDVVEDALKKGKRSIGVVTPYKNQAYLIEAEFNKRFNEGWCYDYPDVDFKAATIHKFQGQERDVVIFDLVYGYSLEGYVLPEYLRGGLTSKFAKLLNVATTRARDFFVLVCDLRYTHKELAKLENCEEQVLTHWLKGIEKIAFAKSEEVVEDSNVAA